MIIRTSKADYHELGRFKAPFTDARKEVAIRAHHKQIVLLDEFESIRFDSIGHFLNLCFQQFTLDNSKAV